MNQGHLSNTLWCLHERKNHLIIHTRFGEFAGVIDAMADDAVTIRSQSTHGIVSYKTIAIHAIHVVDWHDVLTEPKTA